MTEKTLKKKILNLAKEYNQSVLDVGIFSFFVSISFEKIEITIEEDKESEIEITRLTEDEEVYFNFDFLSNARKVVHKYFKE